MELGIERKQLHISNTSMDNPLEVRFKDLLIPKNSEQRSLLLTKEQYYELISELKEAFISTTKSNSNITFLDTTRYLNVVMLTS